MVNRFAYRLPYDSVVHRGGSSSLVQGIGAEGFVVAPFDDAYSGCFTIPTDDTCAEKGFVPEAYNIPAESTTQQQHADGVNLILERISRGELDKCVLSKVVIKRLDVDLKRTFDNLCEARPDAFVFYFDTPQTGAWIGASPEVLMLRDDNEIQSMSLAGTRIEGYSGEWGSKDINEQRIVTDFIVDTFADAGYDVDTCGPMTHKAGNVEHLMTRITSRPQGNVSDVRLLYELSPTPALCGLPRDATRKTLRDAETFDRGYYGGFCGPVNASGTELKLYVNLRSCCIKNGLCCTYAGGGIVAGSKPESEWAETERKAETILNNLIQTNRTIQNI